MKILILHNAYQQRGGEDSVVEAEAALLRSGGHQVRVEIVTNDEIIGASAKANAFIRSEYDPERSRWAAELVRATQADIVHVHNFFPLLTPAVHAGAAKAGAAVVQTLHNYRLLCAAATFLRDGKVCEKCLDGSKAWGVVHRCYRDSMPASLAVARMQWRAQRDQVWQRDVHRFIALTQFAAGKFIAGGLPAERLIVKPNSTPDSLIASSTPRTGGLFVGRLSREKGVDVLIEAWKSIPETPLTIIGDGPERAMLEKKASPNVRFLGGLASEAVHAHMASSAFLVIPSLWYEGLPMTLLEAYANGLPVIASRIGSLEEAVVDKQTGLLFPAGNPNALVSAVRSIDESLLERMSKGARTEYEAKYTASQNLQALEDVYEAASLTRKAGDNSADISRVH